MKNFLINLLKIAVAAMFVIGLDIIIPFTSARGLDFVKAHGKLLLFGIALFNVFIGGAISAGFWSKDLALGFKIWFKPPFIKGEVNPTYAFGAVTLVINILFILLGIQP